MCKESSCYFEPYLVTIFVSSILFSLIFIFSIVQSNNLIQKPCSKVPNVTLSNNFTELINKITDSIQNAKTKVQLSFSVINITIFKNFLLPALKIANKNGAKVTMVFTSDKDLDEVLKDYDFIETYRIDIALQLSSQSIIVDNTAFISPFIVADNSKSTSTLNQLITVDKCDAIAEDITSFVEYWKWFQDNSNSNVLSGKFVAQTSANRPVSIKLLNEEVEKNHKKAESDTKSKLPRAFTFHNPQSFLIPMRIATNHVLLPIFDRDPLSIDIYTLSPQCFSSLDDPESNQLTVYMALKSLLMRNRTKVRYLASKSLFMQKKSSCFTSFLAFENSEMHLYDKQFEGPNYIIAHFDNSNDESYIFAQTINDHEFVKTLSLHLATDDEKTTQYLGVNFDTIWNNSTPLKFDFEY